MLDYRLHAKNDSLYNTPPVFAIYILSLITRWLKNEVGGLAKMAERNAEKAKLLYDVLDDSGGFYRGHARPDCRSQMNVTWRLPSEELEATFVKEAKATDLHELKGHRSVGGIRASIYNAMPLEGVRTLRDFMVDFQKPARRVKPNSARAGRNRVSRFRSYPLLPADLPRTVGKIVMETQLVVLGAGRAAMPRRFWPPIWECKSRWSRPSRSSAAPACCGAASPRRPCCTSPA